MRKTVTDGGEGLTGKALVTGSEGFIGTHLVAHLKRLGYRVFSTDILDKKADGYYKADIRVEDELKVLPKDVDCVIHLASVSFLPQADHAPEKAHDINVLGTSNVLKYFLKTSAQKFIFASSAKVYGSPQKNPVGEDHRIKPLETYGRTKAECERLIAEAGDGSDRAFSILRQFNIYGPGQSSRFFIPKVLESLGCGRHLSLGNLDIERDFLYVKDLCRVYDAVLSEEGAGVNVYNVGSGTPTHLADIISEIETISGKSVDFEVDDMLQRDEEKSIWADISKIRRVGFAPETDLRTGLSQMMGYLRC